MPRDLSPTAAAWAYAHRVARGVFDAEVRAWLQRGFNAWLAEADLAGAGLELTRCLRLRHTDPRTKRLQERDTWLRSAWNELRETRKAAPRAHELRRRLAAFTRSLFAAWAAAGGPPATATRLELALFGLAASGEPLPGDRRLIDICKMEAISACDFTSGRRESNLP